MAAPDGRLAAVLQEVEVVAMCNRVLALAGLAAKVSTLEEVKLVCSSTSVFVAALEGLLGHRIEGVIRTPETSAERAFNTVTVVSSLAKVLRFDLSHISGPAIVSGSLPDIVDLLEILATLSRDVPLQELPGGQRLGSPPFDVLELPSLEAQLLNHQWRASSSHYEGEAADGAGGGGTWSAGEDWGYGSDDGGGAGGLHGGTAGWEDELQAGPRARATGTSSASGHSGGNAAARQRSARRGAGAGAARSGSSSGASTSSGTSIGSGGGSKGSRSRRAGGRSGRKGAAATKQQAVLLSPIMEGMREGRDSATATLTMSNGGSLRGRDATGLPPPQQQQQRSSAPPSVGGSSSAISVPEASQLGSSGGGRGEGVVWPPGGDVCFAEAADDAYLQQHQQRQRHGHGHGLGAGPEGSGPPGSAHSSDTDELLRTALPAADAAVDQLARRGMREGEARARARAMHAVPPDVRVVVRGHAQHGDRSGGGHERFMQAAARRMASGAASSSSSSAASEYIRAERAGARDARKAAAAGFYAPPRRKQPVLRALPGAAPRDANRQAGRAAARTYGSGSARAVALAERIMADVERGAGGGYDSGDSDDDDGGREDQQQPQQQERGDGAWGRGRGRPGKLDGMQLSRDMAGKLRFLHQLAHEEPRAREARARVQAAAVAAEAARNVQRKQLLQRLGRAAARRDAAARATRGRLDQRAEEYDKRVEQLRLQHLAAEWESAQRGARLRRATEAELQLRAAFLHVLGSEKERLLEERRAAQATSAAHLPNFRRAMKRAEGEYLALYNMLEGQIAGERRQRVAASNEALAARRESNKLQAQVVHDRMAELLQRVAAEEEAILFRRSVLHSAPGRQALLEQMRRMIGLN